MDLPPRSNCSSSSCSSSSSSPSTSFSSTPSTQCLTSSSNSPSLSNSNSPSRCEGLDMLVKAVYYVVAGSVIGVPYIQRRVIRRRKRPIHFKNLIITEFIKTDDADSEQVNNNSEGKRRGRRPKSVLPSKYQDSVLHHQWKPPRKKQRRSGKIGAGSGL